MIGNGLMCDAQFIAPLNSGLFQQKSRYPLIHMLPHDLLYQPHDLGEPACHQLVGIVGDRGGYLHDTLVGLCRDYPEFRIFLGLDGNFKLDRAHHAGGREQAEVPVEQAVKGDLPALFGEKIHPQLAGQEQILEEASSGEVLDGEASGRRWLETAIGRKREEQAHYQVMTGDGESWLEELEQLDTDIPLDLLGELYVMPAELEGVTDEAMGHLETSLCDPSSPYRTRDQRKPLVDAYGAYLEAVGDVCYLKMNLVVSEMDEESRSLVLDGAAQMEVFKDAMLDYPINPEKEEGERLLEAAENRLEEARGELRQQNFPMEAEGW